VPPQATPSSMRLSSCRSSGANSESNPRTTRDALTPTAASGLAAFYSATSRFVAFRANLPHGGAWLHDGQVLTDHDTWSSP